MNKILALITLFMSVAVITHLDAADAGRVHRRFENLGRAREFAAAHNNRLEQFRQRFDAEINLIADPAERVRIIEAQLAALERDDNAGRRYLDALAEGRQDQDVERLRNEADGALNNLFGVIEQRAALRRGGNGAPAHEDEHQNWRQRHPVLTFVAGAGIVITASLLIDLAIRGEKSVLGQMYAHLTGKNKVIAKEEDESNNDDTINIDE